MELAAMASAAVPGLTPTGVAGSPDDAADFDAALLVDDAGRRWRVRSPKHLEASMRLETELLVLRTFVPAVRAELPFALPYVAGTVRQGELCTFVYSHLPGATRSIDQLMTAGKSVAAEIGRAMAAVHALPRDLVTKADLPSYSANEFRQRRLNELDQAATTGKIPSVLLRRWEHALEDVSLWRFKPTVVHGDLHEDNILLTGERVSAVTGWTDLRVGDPADDFAWLIAANDPGFTRNVHEAYLEAGKDPEDPHLIRRAALSAEFALAQWLVRGVAAENDAMVDEAVEMLRTLEEDVRAQEAADKRSGQARAAEARASVARPEGTVTPAPESSPAAASTAERPASTTGTTGVETSVASKGKAKVTVAPIAPDSAPAITRPDAPGEDTSAGKTAGSDEPLAEVIALPARADGTEPETTAPDTTAPDAAEADTDPAEQDKAGSSPAGDTGDEEKIAADADTARKPKNRLGDTAEPGSPEDGDGTAGKPGPAGPATTSLPLAPVPDK
ncbi:phosphotransferase [Arthrobacter sp. YD2]|uniref:phosphotransferase n=1 Tax=Arthrobacter sp. YD2 TaxID=3058046 RepID=UPI0033B61C75